MKRRISQRELRRIKKAIKALPGFSVGDAIQVSIALPEPCDEETSEFAQTMIRRLKKINCVATISFILSFPSQELSDKPYEVMAKMPLASPCIKIYAQRSRRGNLYQKLKEPFRTLLEKIKPDRNPET